MLGVWEAYFDYLRSNRPNAMVYVACVSQGYKYPTGYDSPEAVLKRILDDHYDILMLNHPDTKMIAEYLVLAANTVAIGFSSDRGKDVDDLNNKLKRMITKGIMSQYDDIDIEKGTYPPI